MLVPVGSQTLALGMDWSLAMSKGEVRTRLKEKKRAAVSVLSGSDNQFWVGLYEGVVPKRTLSGAALLGLVAPSAIICQSVDDAHSYSWICAIQDGKPVVGGYDAIVTRDEANTRAMEYLTLFSSAQLYGDVTGAKASVQALVEQVEARVADKSITKKMLAACEVRRQGVSVAAVLQLVLIAALPVAGWFGWKEYQKFDIARKAAAINAANASKQAMTAQQLEVEKQRLITEFHAKVAARRAEFQQASRAGNAAPLWLASTLVRRDLPISAAGGYVPTTLNCIPTGCTVTWEGRGRFTMASDKREITGREDSDLATSATTQVPLPAAGVVGTQFPAVSAEWLRRSLTERLKRTPGVSIEEARAVVVEPPPNLGLSPQTVGHAGNIRVQLQGATSLISAADAIAALDSYPVSVTSITYTGLNQGPSVSIEATYQVPGQ